MNDIELSYVTIRYEEPVVYFVFKENTEVGFPEIREMVTCAEKLSGNKPYVTFSDVRVNINITEEGKKYLANPANMPLFRGTAALVKNNMYRFGANLLNSFDKKRYPFRAFVNQQHAVEWLLALPLNNPGTK